MDIFYGIMEIIVGMVPIFFGFCLMILPFYCIYRIAKGLMTHNAELKYKYSQQNQQSEEKPVE